MNVQANPAFIASTKGSNHARDKQFRVESDVRCSAVCGHTVWLGHNDGTVTIRKTRTAEVVRHFVAGNGARVWSMIPVVNEAGSFVWIGLSNGDIEVHMATGHGAAVPASDSSGGNVPPQRPSSMADDPSAPTIDASRPPTTTESRATATPRQAAAAANGSNAPSSAIPTAGDVGTVVRRLSRHTGGVYTMSEFNAQVFSGGSDFQIMQWDSIEGAFVRQLTGHSNYVRALYAEGSLLISGSDDHTVRLWNAVNGQSLGTGRFHRSGLSVLCRVGVTMWSGDESGKVVVWKLQTMEAIETLAAHAGRVSALKKIGSRVYSGGADHEIVIWDALTRALVTKITDHRGWILGLACPAQLCRYYVWSAAADGTVRCWHHDEYRVMNGDAERFDDMRWYHAENTPFHELNSTLFRQLASEESRCRTLAQQCTASSAINQSLATDTKALQEKITDLQGQLGATSNTLATRERLFAQSDEQLAARDRQLRALTDQLKAAQSEAIDLKCDNQRIASQLDESRRGLELAAAERDKTRSALDQTLQSRRLDGGVLPTIVLCEGEAAAAARQLAGDLARAGAELESLRTELARYKSAWTTVAAAGTVPMLPPAYGSLDISPGRAAVGGRQSHGAGPPSLSWSPSRAHRGASPSAAQKMAHAAATQAAAAAILVNAMPSLAATGGGGGAGAQGCNANPSSSTTGEGAKLLAAATPPPRAVALSDGAATSQPKAPAGFSIANSLAASAATANVATPLLNLEAITAATTGSCSCGADAITFSNRNIGNYQMDRFYSARGSYYPSGTNPARPKAPATGRQQPSSARQRKLGFW